MSHSHASPTRTLVSATLLCCAAFLSGCGIDTVDHSITGTSALHGMVHGGQQPVSGAIIQLYTVGSAGNGSLATPMLTRPVLSQSDGSFDITGAYQCGQSSLGVAFNSPSNQVYIVATQGDPGLNPAATNTALVLMTALGDCANLPSATYVEINEITTAAAAWALAPFATSYTEIGASSTNVSGIKNAFLDAALLADSTTGLPATLASNLTIEKPKLISLANALASCVNSDGTTGCTPLFTAAKPTNSVTLPADTLSAALDVTKNPGENVEAVFLAIGDRAPFSGGLTASPNDWTMSLTITGGGLKSPTAMAVDADSNIWVAGENGPLSAFNAQGKPLSDTGFAQGDLDDAFGIAIDTNGDVWVADYNSSFHASGAAIKLLGANSSAQGPLGSVVMNGIYPGFYTDIYYPFGISADTNGNMFLPGAGVGATVLSSDGSVSTPYLGGMSLGAIPNSIAVDAFHGYWIPTGNSGIIHVAADGTSVETTCCETSYGVATDAYHNVWVSNYFGASFSELDNDGNIVLEGIQGGGLQYPLFVAVDAGQNVWFSNYIRSFAEIAGNGGTLTPGTPISPTVGAGKTAAGGYGLDAGLQEPNSIIPDRSGNIWTSNQFGNSVTMFFGLATPTVTPIQPVPTAP